MTGAAAVTVNSDGRLEVFVRGLSGELWHIWQQLPRGTLAGLEIAWRYRCRRDAGLPAAAHPPRTVATAYPGAPEPAAVEAPPVALKPAV